MLDYESEHDTHFQCPQCGQKGSVPSAALEKAFIETPHVHISCPFCAHKFEPFADQIDTLSNLPDDPPTDGCMDDDTFMEETNNSSNEAEENAAPLVPPLAHHWDSEAGDDMPKTSGEHEGSEATGSLPSWIMPPVKPEPPSSDVADCDGEAKADAALADALLVDPSNGARDEDDETAKLDVMGVSEISDEKGSEEPDDTSLDAPFAADSDEIVSEKSDNFDNGNELSADAMLEAADWLVDTQSTLYQESQTDVLNYEQDGLISFDDEIVAVEEVSEARSARPIGVVNGTLLALVLVLTSLNSFMLMRNTPEISDFLSAEAVSSADIKLVSADFETFRDADGDSVEISVRFVNRGEKTGIIGDFRIDLQNASRQTLVSWTVLSSGETVKPNETRKVASTLFEPPDGLAHVDIVYPLEE